MRDYNERFGVCEVFYVEREDQMPDTCYWSAEENAPRGEGWFFWCCSPGCLPEGDPMGPYKTKADAIKEAYDLGFIATLCAICHQPCEPADDELHDSCRHQD